MPFLVSNLMEEISPNTEAPSANTWNFSPAWNSCKDKNDLGLSALTLPNPGRKKNLNFYFRTFCAA